MNKNDESFARKDLKMHFLHSILMLIFVISDAGTLEFIVRGSGPLVAPLGGSVVLPCYVETPLVTENLRVVWGRTDSETLVHLYQDGESRAEEQHKDYHDRAHFFTDQIQHGNFSLRLDNLTAEDKGIYRCKVYSQQVADKTLVEIIDVERLLVSGSSRSISAYDGEDVTLNCSVDSHIKPEHIEVSWKKTDEDVEILVLLYQNNKTLPDSSYERYRDRVEFFTDEIPKGNFSLRLKSVKTEDKGVYMCEVFAGRLSANATVVVLRLGFSVYHITVLILCIVASGSALLFCFRPENGGMHSVLLAEHFKDIDTVIRTVFFCTFALMCLLFIIQLTKEKMLSCSGKLCRRVYSKVQPLVAACSFSLLPSLPLALLLYTRFASGAVFIITVLPILSGMYYFCDGTMNRRIGLCLYKFTWLIMILMSGTMMYFYIMLLRNEKEGAGLVCVAGILHTLWVLAFSEVPVHYLTLDLHKMLFLFGSAGLVLVNSIALMTEVIMNAVNGERLVGDLRVVLFPSEWLFTVSLLISSMFAHCEYELELTLAVCTIMLSVCDII
ncbi:hypothetical protein PO909_001048 [Leuciscus waleckii]